MESETSPDFINDFSKNLDEIVKDQDLKNKMNYNNFIDNNENNISVLIKD